jgi:GntR family transcriptional regulator
MPTVGERRLIVPYYLQITRKLRGLVRTLEPGSMIPSERGLAAEYGVSRMTVREAIHLLRQEGLLYHQRGRGTFVSRRKLDVSTLHLTGFSAGTRAQGFTPSATLLRFGRVAAKDSVADDLGIAPGVPVFHIERVRLADDVPVAHERTFLPVALCPDLFRHDLETDSLYRILKAARDIQVAHATEQVEAALAGRLMARLFGIRSADPVLVVHRVVFTESDRPIESVTTTYRADRYRATFRRPVDSDALTAREPADR